jgi:hypothetical protein
MIITSESSSRVFANCRPSRCVLYVVFTRQRSKALKYTCFYSYHDQPKDKHGREPTLHFAELRLRLAKLNQVPTRKFAKIPLRLAAIPGPAPNLVDSYAGLHNT